jgi:hypothetical protein
MFDFFRDKAHRDFLISFIKLTAKLDDLKPPFDKITRSPNHLVAWFLLYAAVDIKQKDLLVTELKQEFKKHDLPSLSVDELLAMISSILKDEGILKLLSSLQDKIKIELDTDPEQCIDQIRKNGYTNLADFIESHSLIQFNSNIKGISVVSTVEQSVKWRYPLSDATPGMLSVTEEVGGRNLFLYSYNPVTNHLVRINWKDGVALAPHSACTIRGDEIFTELVLNFPVTLPDSALSLKIPRVQVPSGIYELFNEKIIGSIPVFGIAVFIQSVALLNKNGASTQQTQEVGLSRAGPKTIKITFNQSPSALFLDAMIAANFGAQPPQSLAEASVSPILIIEIATQNNSRILLSPFSVTSSDAVAIMEHIKRQKVIGLMLLPLIEGKTADDGKQYNQRYTEYHLLMELFATACGNRNAEGIELILSATIAYQKFYLLGQRDLEKELNHILKVIFSSANTSEPVDKLVQMCRLEKNITGEHILKLPQIVLDIFARLGIHIPEPIPRPSLLPKQAMVKDEDKVTSSKAPTFFASVQPTNNNFENVKNLFEKLIGRSCEVNKSVSQGLDIRFKKPLENVRYWENQFKQLGLLYICVFSSGFLSIPANSIESTIKTLEKLGDIHIQEPMVASSNTPTLFAYVQPTNDNFENVKNLFEQLMGQPCEVNKSVSQGLDIQFKKPLENVRAWENQFKQLRLFGICVHSSSLSIIANTIEPTIKTLEKLLEEKKQLNYS